MLSIAVHYYNSVSANDGSGHLEWPPAVDRLFQALVNASKHNEPPESRDVLLLIEKATAPSMHVCREFYQRTEMIYFVPVSNFKKGTDKIDFTKYLNKQPQRFMSGEPRNKTVYFIWDLELKDSQLKCLDSLCSKIPYLGSSESIVEAWVESSYPEPNFVPVSDGKFKMRVPKEGRLQQLEDEYNPLEQRSNLSPADAYCIRYDWAEDPLIQALFSEDLLIFTGPSNNFDISMMPLIMEKMRATIMRNCPDPLPEWISGHDGDVQTRREHLAFLPIPYVGNQHADGRIMGVALAYPRNISISEWRRCLGPSMFGSPLALNLGAFGVWKIQLVNQEDSRQSLHPKRWVGPSRVWSTVTPIALNKYPKRNLSVEDIIATGCLEAGLPKPKTIEANPNVYVKGSLPANKFPPYIGGNQKRLLMHATLYFDSPVLGPVLIGAGRYRGYGMCCPF